MCLVTFTQSLLYSCQTIMTATIYYGLLVDVVILEEVQILKPRPFYQTTPISVNLSRICVRTLVRR